MGVEKGSVELFRTEDGSPSLYHSGLDETYHSTHGALQESHHVFIEKGLKHPYLKGKSPLRILEVGFGTGINAWLCAIEAEREEQELHYESLEPYPLEEGMPERIAEELDKDRGPVNFLDLHRAKWEEWCRISSCFHLKKRKLKLEDLEDWAEAELILYDAFGGRAQPEMWDSPVLECALNRGTLGSIFVTYCAKGTLKRCLKRNGWEMESLEGAPGKREMVRGRKKA